MASNPRGARIEGLEQVLKKMDGLSYDVRRKGGRFAMRKAANLVRDAAKANAKQIDDPATSESIADNIAVRFSSREFRQTGNVNFRIGVRGGAKSSSRGGFSKRTPGGDTWYWRLLEFGTQKMAARPFMRRALTENIDKATGEFVTEYNKALDRAIRRAGR